jgi:hypothetical protein
MKNYKRIPINLLFSVSVVCATLAAAAHAQQAAITPPANSSPAATPKPAPATIKIGGVTIFGSLRLRGESWDWFDPDPAFRDSYAFGAYCARAWAAEGEIRMAN